jgi:hypothetical protein
MQTEHPDETSDSALDRISLIAAKDDFQDHSPTIDVAQAGSARLEAVSLIGTRNVRRCGQSLVAARRWQAQQTNEYQLRCDRAMNESNITWYAVR